MQSKESCCFGIAVRSSQRLDHDEGSLELLEALSWMNFKLSALEVSSYLEKVLQTRLLQLAELV